MKDPVGRLYSPAASGTCDPNDPWNAFLRAYRNSRSKPRPLLFLQWARARTFLRVPSPRHQKPSLVQVRQSQAFTITSARGWTTSAQGQAFQVSARSMSRPPNISPSSFAPRRPPRQLRKQGDAALYQPQSPAGLYTATGVQFLTGAPLAPGSVRRKIPTTLASGLTSEAAGQATQGSAAEPYARFLAAA